MQTYKNTTPTSCVWDAFKMAGIPVEDWMLYGVRTDKIVEILLSHGWSVHIKGATVSPKKPFIVMRDWKKEYAHLEYHESIHTVLDYPSDSIGAVFTKE